MARIAYVDGRYRPLAEAAVHVEDRGFQFADGVYEVVFLSGGRLVDAELHLARLARSLRELRMAAPASPPALRQVMAEVVRRNRLADGLVYIQVTRGTAPRLHPFPAAAKPTLVITLRRAAAAPPDLSGWSGTAITCPDDRWARCDIKSVSLLPNILAKQAAVEAGAVEAILVGCDGLITEGASTTVWIVDAAGVLCTRPLSHAILPGCTRAALIEDLAAAGIALEERAFSVPEMRAAREVFVSAATSFVKPILAVDGQTVADGAVGPVARRLYALFKRRLEGAGPAPT